MLCFSLSIIVVISMYLWPSLISVPIICPARDNHQLKVIFVSSWTLYATTPWFPRVKSPFCGLAVNLKPLCLDLTKAPFVSMNVQQSADRKMSEPYCFPLAGPHDATGRASWRSWQEAPRWSCCGCWSGLSEKRREANRWHWCQVGQLRSQPEGGSEHGRMEEGLEAK